MKSVGGPGGVQTRQLKPALRELNDKSKAAKAAVRQVEAQAAQLVEQDEGLAKFWTQATGMRRGREAAMLSLIEQVDATTAEELQETWEDNRRLGSTVASFRSLCHQLDAANARGEDRVLSPAVTRHQQDARLGMLQDIETVSRGLKAAGLCEAVSKFPLAQLDALKKTVRTQVEALAEVAPENPPPLLRAADVATAADAAKAIGALLGNPGLADDLVDAMDRAEDPVAYARDLGAFALMMDQAASAPDYRMTRMGWHYGRSRGAYRARAQQPLVMYLSEERLAHSSDSAQDSLQGVIGAEKPGEALATALTQRFLQEIGVPPRRAKGWAPTAAGIGHALSKEALVPLRALNETVQDMAGRHGNDELFRSVVEDVTQSIVEGRYESWRSTNPASARQLAPLDDAQREAWLSTDVHAEVEARHGGQLTTREEDGVDLLWLTKIGGPSHGFDFGGHCLLPLLANARTRAIVVEDTKWPDNPAARAYLRLVEKDGAPVLYLEPLQRDFPHRDEFGHEPDPDFSAALVQHAAEKARQLGVPLSMDIRAGGVAKFLGLATTPDDAPTFTLAASGGVLEASDTLTDRHDWVQTQDEVVKPHNPRLTYTPNEA